MSDKTNEEKLKILKERLATIQQKKEINRTEEVKKDKPVSPVFEEDLVNERNPESDSTKKKSSVWKIIFFLILFSSLLGFGYYFYNNDFKIEPTIDNIKEDFDTLSKEALSFFEEEEEEEDDDDDERKKKKKKDSDQLENIIYNKSSFDGNFIIVLKNFEKEKFANDEAKKLTEKGYNCNVLQLSGVSNSDKEIFQTYIQGKNIGVGFETKKEARHYLNSTELISAGDIFKLQ
mgnify:CR=1 FL=1